MAVGGIAFLLAGVFTFVWAGVQTLSTLSERPKAVNLLRRSLREPFQTEITRVRALPPGKEGPSPTVSVQKDLVKFSASRAVINDINAAEVLSNQRAEELYDKGFPADPGDKATRTVLPRKVLTIFSADRHKHLKPAGTAALIGAATSLLMCAVIATGAARFALPGAGALLGFILLRYHLFLFNFWVSKSVPGGLLFRGQAAVAADRPGRQVLFVAIALLAAGLIYSALLGGTKAVAKERRRRKRAQARKAQPAVAAEPAEAVVAAVPAAGAEPADELQE